MGTQSFYENLREASATMKATGDALMQGRREVSYETQEGRTFHPLGAEHPAYTFPKNVNGALGQTPDHLSVSGMVNLLANDARQLLEEIHELHSRLTPILSEQKTPPNEKRLGTPAQCKMAAELSEVEEILKQAREVVYLTMAQIDL